MAPAAPLALALALALAAAAAAPAQDPARPPVLLVPMPAEPSWQDFAFLASVPAAAATAGGRPLVLAVAADGTLAAEQRDFLRRARPARVVWVGTAPNPPGIDGIPGERLPADSADAAAVALLALVPPGPQAVVVPADDYGAALAGAVLAARLPAPLLFAGPAGLAPAVQTALAARANQTLLLVGEFGKRPPTAPGMTTRRLGSAGAVARWLVEHGRPVRYLAAAAPADRHLRHGGKVSLAAALLAAGRGGALVPLGSDTTAPANAAAAQAALQACQRELGAVPELLCLAGAPAAIPMPTVPSGAGVDSDPPSDLSYGNADADPFVETGLARFVAADGPAATLLAARNLAYQDLVTKDFAGRFAVAEWERLCAPLFGDVGFQPPAVHAGGKPFGADSPLASVAALVHGAHSSWLQLGETATWADRTLLAPCLVESSGCSAAALDQDPEHRSVALQLLRHGAVAFVGNVRRGVAQSEHYRSEFWHAVLAGQPLGHAHRLALNRVLAAMTVHGELDRGLRRYQLYNAACYGDPAFVLHRPAAPRTAPARTEQKGREVVVHAPASWWRAEQVIVPDWQYDRGPSITSWRGAGVGVDCSWDGEAKRNRDELVFTAEARTRARNPRVVALDQPPAPLGWNGRWAIDEHGDGTRSVYFRVRLIDFDMDAGVVRQQVDRLRFRLE